MITGLASRTSFRLEAPLGDLSANFNRSEFACKCGCGANNVSMVLVDKLQKLRDAVGRAIVINSACRCHDHNARVGGVMDSAHLSSELEACEAADIKIKNGHEAFSLVGFIYFYKLFKRVFIEQGCVHVDIDETKPSPWLGVYHTGRG